MKPSIPFFTRILAVLLSSFATVSVFGDYYQFNTLNSGNLFSMPSGVAVDANGNVFVAETDASVIRKITPAGVVSTFAGLADTPDNVNGTGADARFNFPQGMAVDMVGNVYVADAGNNVIRKITQAGVVTTFATGFNLPYGVALDKSGNVYVADTFNNTICKVSPAGTTTIIAGAAGLSGNVNAVGTNARFNKPVSVAVDDEGNVYVADSANHAIRKITPTGTVTTLAGDTAGGFGFVDGTGASARFAFPHGVSVDAAGNIYVADAFNNSLRKITPAGSVTTFAGAATSGNVDGNNDTVRFNAPNGVAIDGAGRVYVADTNNGKILSGIEQVTIPVIGQQPATQALTALNPLVLSVAATGSSLTYQWYFNGNAIAGATSANYNTTAHVANAGSYKVGVTNAGGTILSAPAVVTVNAIPATFVLSTVPLIYSGTMQSPVVIPSPAEATFIFSSGYQSSATNAGSYVSAVEATGDYLGSLSFDWVIAKATPVITWQPPTEIGYGFGLNAAQLNATANVPGSFLYVPGIGSVLPSGANTLSATFTPSDTNNYNSVAAFYPVTVQPSPFISQPVSQTMAIGYQVTFSVQLSDAPSYQWQKNGADIVGATGSSYSIASVTTNDSGVYRVLAIYPAGSVASNLATLTIAPRVGSTSASADFNGDGKSDLLWQNTSTGERSIWLMNGTTLTAGVSLGLSPSQWSIAAVADFNADGQPDLLWQNTLTGERTIWLMNGSTFVSSVALGTYSTDLMIAGAGDFNGDGKPDLVWQNTSTGERSIWLMNGTTVGSVIELGTFPPEWSIAGTGEFNGDGKCDLIWQNTVTGERAIWLMNGTSVTAGVALGVYPQLQISGTGDYNGDGKTDILWTNVNTGERIIWLMNGTTKASEVSLGVVDLNWVLNRPVFRRVLSDFNNDGKSDLVWQNTATGDRAIWIMNGIEARTGLSLGNYAVDQWIAAIGDFNNDGKADLVWENRTTGARSIMLMNGTTVLSTVVLGTYGTEWKINTTGDFNADGKPDLVWTNTATGARAIWLMDGTAFTAGVDLGTVPVAQQIAGTGDFNADGQTDILWQNTSTGERTIWLMNGTTHTSTVTLGTYAPEWSIVGTGDYNADGKPDLLWQNTTTGERAIWLMNGTTFLSSSAIGTYDTNWSIRN